MLKFNLTEDEELCGTINIFISGLLPHEKFEPTHFTGILSSLFKFIRLEEFQLEYWILLDALCELNRVKISFTEYEPQLSRVTMERLLEASIFDIVVRPELGVAEWLSFEGIGSNLNIQSVKEDVCQRLCTRTMELYDECFNLSVRSKDVLSHEPELRAAFIAHVGTQCITVQADIVRHEARVGRKRYRGFDDWLSYVKHMSTEISERLKEAEENKILKLDSVEGSFALLKEIQSLLVPIANYGIPEIDAYTPILRHRLVVVVGRENIGKTKFAVDQTVNVLLAGGKVAYMCGESQKSRVFGDVMINYVYKKFGIIIRNEHLTNPEECPDDVRKIIGMAIDSVVSNGGLILCNAFNYGSLYEEMTSLYEMTGFDAVIIDHSCALEGTTDDGSVKAKIDKLAEDSRRFKKKFPVCVMVMSHPSIAVKTSDRAGKNTVDSPTKGSQNLSTEADEVFYLRDNDTLQKQGLVMLENTKRRDAGIIIEPILLKKKFEVSVFEYDASAQGENTAMTVQREEALRVIDEQCSVNQDIYSL